MYRENDTKIKRTARIMLWIAMLGLLAFLTWLFATLGAEEENRLLRVSGATVTIHADRQGHYRASGKLNGQAVDFLLDTGATNVAIPEKLAQQLGLPKGPQIQLQTANGISQGYLTRVAEVRLGSIRVKNVSAVISSGLGGEALLGMSFLRHLNWRHSNNELILEPESIAPGDRQ